ncbi:P-loop containing nucleoside triphosphate hydrolase protein [Heliocybe sulcata]|uniref:RNA helicase n=1 Tax=Heliocybe sulcata TaxID=5364 RepID=A0A5C3MUY1_9AGAM|nr:P-loop containing nucleoside triphosphate hydrolase protein [Heliocybe sulcata]
MPTCECGENISARHLDAHRNGKRHRTKLRAREHVSRAQGTGTDAPAHTSDASRDAEYQRPRETSSDEVASNTERNRNGVSVSWEDGLVDFGILEADEVHVQDMQVRTVTIRCIHDDAVVSLEKVQLRSSFTTTGAPFIVFDEFRGGSTFWDTRNPPLLLPIHFHTTHAGRFTDTLELHFRDATRRQSFTITRRLLAVIGSQDDYQRLMPQTPYIRPQAANTSSPLEARSIPAGRPPTWTPADWTSRLPEYPIHPSLQGLAQSPGGGRALKQRMPVSLGIGTYGDWFQIPLWVNEEQKSINLQKYTLKDVKLTRKDPNYSVHIPGLLDKKPQILVGDKIVISRPQEDNSWEGRVHAVLWDDVRLRMPSDFSLYRGDDFDVLFLLNRLPLRRMHHAVLSRPYPERILFPRAAHIIEGPAATGAFDSNFVQSCIHIQDDPDKLRAVFVIANQPAGSVPFVLFGPPGTGKTTAIVEAICQLLTKDQNHRIIACAQSNRAADTIALKLRLANVQPDAMLRLNAMSRSIEDLPPELRPFCPINGNNVFATPSLKELSAYRVVVCTSVSGGIPSGLGVKRGHFSHVFIDEAGQSAEPESMIPILSLAGRSTNVILAGDTCQLGPVIESRIAADLGLKESFLDRIMKMDIYNVQPWRDMTIVRLKRQYRSHPDILAFSSDQFYRGELQNCADPSITHRFLSSSILVTKGYPVVFHGITGKEYREGSSPSFFNIDEASLVKMYCEKLAQQHRDLKAEDVGIITPYLAQRGKIMQILPDEFKDAKVGTVEDFQGQERLVIILSMVRSNTRHISGDLRHSLGFLANPRRTNVALTRARSLLIVIGDPRVLSLDPTWRNWLDEVNSRRGARGQPIPASTGYDGNASGEEGQARARDADRMQRIRANIVRREGYEGVLGGTASDSEDEDEVLNFLGGR